MKHFINTFTCIFACLFVSALLALTISITMGVPYIDVASNVIYLLCELLVTLVFTLAMLFEVEENNVTYWWQV